MLYKPAVWLVGGRHFDLIEAQKSGRRHAQPILILLSLYGLKGLFITFMYYPDVLPVHCLGREKTKSGFLVVGRQNAFVAANATGALLRT